MAATKMAIVKTDEQKPRLKRERIVMIETKPDDDWFVQTKTTRGRIVYYLRFQMTGMWPRLYGPFASKRQCLLFLDDGMNELVDGISTLDDCCSQRMIHEECQKIWPPIVEYPILVHAHSPTKKGR